MTGRLTGVGVGPGDPGLLTLKAIEALHDADVVAYFAKAGNESNARTIVAKHLNGAQELPLLYPVTTEVPKEDAAYRGAIRDFYDASADAGEEPFEQERPPDETIRSADQAHDGDLARSGEHRYANRGRDDDHRNQREGRSQGDARPRRDRADRVELLQPPS